MNTLAHCAFWGAFSTVVMTIILAGSQGAGFTRMSLPFLLGTIFTANRERAKIYGILIHLVNGVLFAWLYLWGFIFWDGASWWKGAVFGAVHAGFLLTCVVTLLPGIHPRMATEHEGPTVVRQLEPPGFLGIHYGRRTPLSIFVAHLTFGILLGWALHHPPGGG